MDVDALASGMLLLLLLLLLLLMKMLKLRWNIEILMASRKLKST